jgi:hypothetical protein
MIDMDAIRRRWEAVGAHLDERGRRLFAAAEVRSAVGAVWLAAVVKITGGRARPSIATKMILMGRRCRE